MLRHSGPIGFEWLKGTFRANVRANANAEARINEKYSDDA